MSNQSNSQQHTLVSSSSSSSHSTTRNSNSQLPITPDREKLSRTLGAAFLQHKVQQLERNLDNLSFRRDIKPPIASRSHSSNHPINRPATKNQSSFKSKSLYPSSSERLPQHPNLNLPPPLKLIDTSVLIHALPILKKWTRDGRFKIIIPLDVISQLDLLKTSPPPIHGLVREATSWLDSQFKHSNKEVTTNTFDKPCLVPQRTEHESRWDDLSKRFIAPSTEVASITVLSSELANPQVEGDHDQPQFMERALISTDLPQQYRSLLQCALFYQAHAQPNQKTELVIFVPGNSQTRSTQSQVAESQQPMKSTSVITVLNKAKLTNPDKLDAEEELIEEKLVELYEWAHYFQLQVDKVFPSHLAEANQSIRNQNQKRKVHNSQHHHQRPVSHHQDRLTPKVSPHPPNQSPSKPITPRTILKRNCEQVPSTSISADQNLLHS